MTGQTMLAARIHAFGGPEVFQLDTLPLPAPGAGEVLVQIKAVGVNFFETELRAGALPFVQLPHTLGMDGAGIVAATGPGVTEPEAGQSVVIFPHLACDRCAGCLAGLPNRCDSLRLFGVHRPGAYAQYVLAPARNAIVFDGLPFEAAASLLTPFMTAWHLLRRRAPLQAGQTILIVGAGGGVGTAAVQIARLSGAVVFAATSSPSKAARLTELGADAVFDYKEGDPWQEARRLTGGRGPDVVLDYGGAATVGRSLAAVAKGGSVLVVGSVTGDMLSELNLRSLYNGHVSLLGHSGSTRADLQAVFSEARRGRLRPVLDRSFALAEAARAHQALVSPDKFGCIALIP